MASNRKVHLITAEGKVLCDGKPPSKDLSTIRWTSAPRGMFQAFWALVEEQRVLMKRPMCVHCKGDAQFGE